MAAETLDDVIAGMRDLFIQEGLLREFYYTDDGDGFIKCMDCDIVKGDGHRSDQCRVGRCEKALDRLVALRTPDQLPKLKSREMLKGTGDVLKDIAYAQQFTDDAVDRGYPMELQFVDRALRVAAGEIKQLRQRLTSRAAAPSQAPQDKL